MWPWWLLVALLSLALSLILGSGDIVWSELFSSQDSLSKTLFWQLRFPRALAAASVGGGLALVGAVLQSSLRNSLADPFLLGVSSAAATGAVLALALGLPSARFPLAALACLLCLLFLDKLSFRGGKFSNHTLLIGGVAVTYLFSSVTALVVVMADPQKTRGLIFWLMGGFSAVEPSASWTCFVAVLGCFLFLQSRAHQIDILATGDENSHILGLRSDKLRRSLFYLSSVLVGIAVATAGGIGFVGILVPHLARFSIGVSHRQLLMLCLLGGAALTLSADTFCRTLLAPREIPVGLVTALLGAPFFLYQLRKGGSWT